MILLNLVCSDFSVSILGNPFTLVSAIFHRWVFGHKICVLYGFFMALLGITSITTLTVLSFERYMMVSRPFSTRRLTSRGACVSVLLIWFYSLAVTTPPLFGWGSYVSEAANISCSVNWQEQSSNAFTYIMFLFTAGQFLPCLVIGFSYYNILRTMRRNAERMGRTSRAETKVTLMVLLMIVAFMVAWTPYSVVALVEQFGKTGTVTPSVGVIPALIAKSSICYNPLIYVGMNTQFHSSIKRLFGIHTKPTKIDHTAVSEMQHRSQGYGSPPLRIKTPPRRKKRVVISDTAKKKISKYNVYAEHETNSTRVDSGHRNVETCDMDSGCESADMESGRRKLQHSASLSKLEKYFGNGHRDRDEKLKTSEIRYQDRGPWRSAENFKTLLKFSDGINEEEKV